MKNKKFADFVEGLEFKDIKLPKDTTVKLLKDAIKFTQQPVLYFQSVKQNDVYVVMNFLKNVIELNDLHMNSVETMEDWIILRAFNLYTSMWQLWEVLA